MQTEQLIFAIVVGYFFIGCAVVGFIIEDDVKTPAEAHGLIVLLWPTIVALFIAILFAALEVKVAHYVRSNKEVD